MRGFDDQIKSDRTHPSKNSERKTKENILSTYIGSKAVKF